MSSASFEKNIQWLLSHPTTAQQFAAGFAKYYETDIALSAVPTPVVTGRRAGLENALLAAVRNPAAGSPAIVANGIVQGLTLYWPGVPVPGGAVTAFLGGPALQAYLISTLSIPGASTSQVAQRLTSGLRTATQLVQYIIGVAPPAFLVVP